MMLTVWAQMEELGGGGGYFTPTSPEPPKQVKYALRVFASSSLYFLTIAGHYSEMINLLVTDEWILNEYNYFLFL